MLPYGTDFWEKFYYVRFTTNLAAVEKPSKAKKLKGPWEKDVKKEVITASSSYGNAIVSTGNYGNNDISLPPVPPTAFPQSV